MALCTETGEAFKDRVEQVGPFDNSYFSNLNIVLGHRLVPRHVEQVGLPHRQATGTAKPWGLSAGRPAPSAGLRSLAPMPTRCSARHGKAAAMPPCNMPSSTPPHRLHPSAPCPRSCGAWRPGWAAPWWCPTRPATAPGWACSATGTTHTMALSLTDQRTKTSMCGPTFTTAWR